MKIAMSSLLFSNLKLENALKQLAEMGYGYVELGALQDWCHVQPKEVLENPEKMYGELTELLDKSSLEAVAFNSNMGNEELDRFDALAFLAHRLHIPLITVPSGPNTSSIDNEIKRLKPLLNTADKYSIQLTVESHVGALTEQPEQAHKLLKELPELGLTLDVAHYYCNGTEEEADKLLPYVKHIHFRDCGRGWTNIQLPYGKGKLDMKYWIQALKNAGYNGNIGIEYIDLPGIAFDHIKAAQQCEVDCQKIWRETACRI